MRHFSGTPRDESATQLAQLPGSWRNVRTGPSTAAAAGGRAIPVGRRSKHAAAAPAAAAPQKPRNVISIDSEEDDESEEDDVSDEDLAVGSSDKENVLLAQCESVSEKLRKSITQVRIYRATRVDSWSASSCMGAERSLVSANLPESPGSVGTRGTKQYAGPLPSAPFGALCHSCPAQCTCPPCPMVPHAWWR